jgi:hypothetical protein
LANNIAITLNAQIQVADQTLPPGSPFIYSRNPAILSAPAVNMVEQVVNLTASFPLPISPGGASYSMVYIRNLQPASSNALLSVNITVGSGGILLNLAAGAYLLMGSPIASNQISITAIAISAFANAYPLLAEYALGSSFTI